MTCAISIYLAQRTKYIKHADIKKGEKFGQEKLWTIPVKTKMTLRKVIDLGPEK